jgi:hypothetical protein
MIPVHNLTENQYDVRVGDEFINVEFTKISDIHNTTQVDTLGEKYTFEYKKNRGKTFDFPFINLRVQSFQSLCH